MSPRPLSTEQTVAKALKGRTIVKVVLNPFSDGRGGQAYDPQFFFDDGSTLRFSVIETETVYGVSLALYGYAEGTVDLYEDGAGRLAIWSPSQETGFFDVPSDGCFFEDARALLAGDTGDWTADKIVSAPMVRPNGWRFVARYLDGVIDIDVHKGTAATEYTRYEPVKD